MFLWNACFFDHPADVGNLISGSSAFFSKFSMNTFRYDLNQVPYDYTVEVTNRFKGLDLIDRVPVYYGWRFITLYRRQGSRPST